MNTEQETFTEEDFLADLYLFYQYFIASNYKDSVPAPHIRELANKLMELALHGDGKHRLAVSMPPRHPVQVDTPIYTSNRGWTTHGELQVGDKVGHPTGGTTEVLKVYPPILCDNQLTFSNGDTIICGDYHIWKIYNTNTDKTELYYTYQLTGDLTQYKIPYNDDYISLVSKTKTNEALPSNCITVDSSDGMYLIGENRTPTHNSKSSMVTLAFPLWILFQDPNTNIMIVTGSPKLAEKFGIQLREYVREIGAYFNVYLSKVKQASTHIMFCDKDEKLYKGNIMLASSGGGITGQDADYLILDDPYTGNDSEFTPSALQQKIDWVNRVVEQRIEPHTKYCVLHTRWHDASKDTPVFTVNRGWITHGELEVGDTLLGTNKKHTKVTKVHPTTQCNNCLVFSNGDKIICGDEHLWRVHNHKENTTRIHTTYELMQSKLHNDDSYESLFTININRSKCISLVDAYKIDKPVPSNCITVDAHDGIYLIGENFTPTHNSNDIIGYYKETEPELYEFIEFPAIDNNGKVLWEERYTKEEILKKKEIVGERVFQSVYQQKPIDTTSDYFTIDNLKFGVPENYVSQQCIRAWDIASSDATTNNDFTAGVRCHRYDDYFIIDDLVHGRFGNHVNGIIKTTAMNDTPNVKILIETGVGNAKLLYEEWKNQLKGYIVERAEVSGRGGSKADRATPFKNALEDGKVYINISDDSLRQLILDEMKAFPFSGHDDIIDAIAHAYNALFLGDKLGRKVNACFGIIKGL